MATAVATAAAAEAAAAAAVAMMALAVVEVAEVMAVAEAVAAMAAAAARAVVGSTSKRRLIPHAMMQIRKGSPKQQQTQPQSQFCTMASSVVSRPKSAKVHTAKGHKNNSKKKSRTTHAAASCVFCVVGPLNQFGSISWLGLCGLHSLNARPAFHCDLKVAQPCPVYGQPSGPPYT